MAKSSLTTPAHDLAPDDDDKPTPRAATKSHDPNSRTVKLGDAGSLTFTLADVHLLDLSPTERTLVFNIVDQLDAYERTATATTTAPPTPPTPPTP